MSWAQTTRSTCTVPRSRVHRHLGHQRHVGAGVDAAGDAAAPCRRRRRRRRARSASRRCPPPCVSTRRIRSSERLRSRNSSGSMPAAAAMRVDLRLDARRRSCWRPGARQGPTAKRCAAVPAPRQLAEHAHAGVGHVVEQVRTAVAGEVDVVVPERDLAVARPAPAATFTTQPGRRCRRRTPRRGSRPPAPAGPWPAPAAPPRSPAGRRSCRRSRRRRTA